MITQTLVAVVLPAGPGPAGRPRANIYLSPRLSGAHLLSAFPDWLSWTRLVSRHGISFTLSDTSTSTTVAADLAPLRPDIWEAVFRHDALVDEYQAPDFTKRLLVSYPYRDAHDFLRSTYQFASTVPAAVASRELRELLRAFVFRDEEGNSTIDQTLSQLRVAMWSAQNASEPGTHTHTHTIQFQALPAGNRALAERFALYHHLPTAATRPPLPTKPGELAKLIDFHQALTSLAGYPSLLPVLGLVFPVELPAAFCPDSPAAGAYRTVQVTAVTPGWTWTHAPGLTLPATAYVRGHGQFTAAPATPPGGSPATADIVEGFLALTPADFSLVGVDLDGALLKIMALADSLANAERLDGHGTSLADGLLPALRSSGLSLLADNRAQLLLQAIRDNQGFLSGSSTRPLDARDVTRGYRIDVYSDRDNAWRSLHRRDGTYRFGDGHVAAQTEDEEGFTQLAVVQPADDPGRPPDPVATSAGAPQPGTDLYVNERVARWNGWSLSAPRPGTPLNRDPDPTRALDADPTAGQPVTSFAMTSSFAAHPGTLPLLRFGARYRVRARAVDLAGHSVPLSAATPGNLAAPAGGDSLPHFRFEPVGHPLLVPGAEPGPGGSLAQLVIRTFNSNPSLDAVPTAESDDRHVLPPRAAVATAEQHGMLDDPAGRPRGDAATYQMIVDRDAAQVPQIEPGPQLPAVGYFPDPLARGAALAGLLAATGVTQVPFGGAWPDLVPFRVRLVEGDGPPAWDAADRVLTVSLPKGGTVTAGLSCYVHPDDLDLLGVWNWIRQLFEQDNQAALQAAGAGPEAVANAERQGLITQAVLDGRNEFITPSLPVSFTHACQQPLGRPAFTRLPIVSSPDAATLSNSFSPVTAWRSLGSHHAVLLGALQINGATTAAIDLEARWIDWLDDLDEPGPSRRQGSGHVERITLTRLDGGPVPADGKGARQVAVYLPGIDTLWFAAPFDQLPGVPSPSAVAAPVHVLGDTKHRTVRYRAVASSRFQEYFPEPGTVTSRTGQALTVDVPSSARPLPPDIVYVIPAFGWDRQVSTNTKTEVRQGNSLRVYLRRPWYSSGSGELLGVVLWPDGGPPPNDDQREAGKAVFTQWGLDPVWASGPLAAVPSTGTFPGARRTASGLTLRETEQPVDVAGHDVGYDSDRRLWYCDIEFYNPYAYAPFVRLALARYQPRSIPGVELSQAALADFAQLTPDRSVSLTVDPADPRGARVVVAGLAPDGPTSSYFTVEVEARLPDVGTDLGWHPATPAQARVTEDSPAPSQPGSVLYAATVRFGSRPAPGQFRLVVREFEVLRIDSPPTALTDTPEHGTRLVHASILPFDFPVEVR